MGRDPAMICKTDEQIAGKDNVLNLMENETKQQHMHIYFWRSVYLSPLWRAGRGE